MMAKYKIMDCCRTIKLLPTGCGQNNYIKSFIVYQSTHWGQDGLSVSVPRCWQQKASGQQLGAVYESRLCKRVKPLSAPPSIDTPNLKDMSYAKETRTFIH